MDKPTVFVSSTIYDFADLRSALKYWLEEMGFGVRMSEFNDFVKDSSENSYDACLKAIEECDYYILLIGSRVGGLFSKEPKISITEKEYQIANQLANEGKLKKMFVFVRKDIWTIKEDRKALAKFLTDEYVNDKEIQVEEIVNHSSKFINDAEFIINFINEVGKVDEMIQAVKSDQTRPKYNWINTFSTFEDIVTVLKAELHIRTNLLYIRWGEIVLQEVARNITLLCYKDVKDGKLIPYFSTAYMFREAVPKQMGGSFSVETKYANGAAVFGAIGCLQGEQLSCEMIEGAVKSGVFLSFNSNYDDYETGNIQKALQEMLSNINMLKKISEQMNNNIEKVANMLKKLKTDQPGKITLDTNDTDIIPVLAAYDCHFNIWELSRYLFAVIKLNYDIDKFPQLKPKGIFDFSEDDLVWGNLSVEDVYNYFVPREK